MYKNTSRQHPRFHWPVTILFPLFVAAAAALHYKLLGVGHSSASQYPKCGVLFTLGGIFACVSSVAFWLKGCCEDRNGPFEQEQDISISHAETVYCDEWKAIERRRQHAGIGSQWACSLACPGGGIRQANFVIGCIMALVSEPEVEQQRPLWRHVDYLSAVSGGGYAVTSMVSHLLDAKGDFDANAQKAAAQSARRLRTHANWPMERNWPRCLDAVFGRSWCGTVFNVVFVIVLGIAQFVLPFILLWSITVVSVPATMLITIDVPRALASGNNCKMWSAWWLSNDQVLSKFSVALICILGVRATMSAMAGSAQKKVNKVSPETNRNKDGLVERHARITCWLHLTDVIFGFLAFTWLFACAFAASGFNCGVFFKSDRKILDLSLLGSAALLLIVCQSQNASTMKIPALFLILGAMLIYSLACVHFGAWLRCSGCDIQCCVKTLGGRFFNRTPFFLAVTLWGLHPVAFNLWSFLLPRWYSWKLSRYLREDQEWQCLGDLRRGYMQGAQSPYMLMCCTVHHIWRLPSAQPDGKLERLRSSTFVFSPLFVGDGNLGFVSTGTTPLSSVRVAGVAEISGAAMANQISERSSPFHHVLIFFSGLSFGMWMQFEPDTKAHTSFRDVVLMIGFALVHFVSVFGLALGYELCAHPLDPADRFTLVNWSCSDEGRGYIICGLVLLIFELGIAPVFITWAKPLWRTPFFGKWLSEWMQFQGFSFPHGASSASGIPRHVYLSDGGHTDNLGILQPMRRRSRVIICPHAGVSHTHTKNILLPILALAGEDASINASFTPLAWKDGKFQELPGSLAMAFDENSVKSEKSVILVGIKYGHPMISGCPSTFQNRWGVLVCLLNRPPAPAQCESWGIAPPSHEYVQLLNQKLADVRLSRLLHCTQEQGINTNDIECLCPVVSRSDDYESLAEEGDNEGESDVDVSIARLHERVGICWNCCHRLPRALSKLLAMFGRFPYHHTALQCLTPRLAKDYQLLGYAMTAIHEDLLCEVFSLLKDNEEKPIWCR